MGMQGEDRQRDRPVKDAVRCAADGSTLAQREREPERRLRLNCDHRSSLHSLPPDSSGPAPREPRTPVPPT